ncbi:DUF3093 domain-containing protein [Sinomonas mesophila]|uniref:DUF3093 domain-containing protein n=1 Tax=Sinomonas mesophila TaxID=1531955 RepID=UPI0009855857|nr:DUF3093 domain-containing protein [Sinomonas mesophila]
MPHDPTPALGGSAPTGQPALYSERLWPAWWVWLVALGISGAGILIFAPISLAAGYIAAAVIFALLAGGLVASTPVVAVTAEGFRAGRASLPLEFVGAVEAFDGEDATAERGPRLNALAYLCIRGWIPAVVRVELTDPEDTTPYWLVSTRRPARLAATLAEAAGGRPARS